METRFSSVISNGVTVRFPSKPPDRILASRIVNGAVVRTRPLCPYSRKARYTGKGSTDDAATFVCQ